jgi:chromate transporter
LPAVAIFLAALAVLYLWKSKFNVLVIILVAGAPGWLVFR